MSDLTARQALGATLEAADRLAVAQARYERVLEWVRLKLAGEGIDQPSPEDVFLRAESNLHGSRALREYALAQDAARTHGTVAIALLLEELLTVLREPKVTPDGGYGGAVKRAAGRPAPRPAPTDTDWVKYDERGAL